MSSAIQPAVLLAAVLKPVVRLCLRFGIRFHDLHGSLKAALVQESRAIIEKAGGEPSVSKISVITGINRVEITKLLSGARTPSGSHDVLTRVIGLWSQAAAFKDATSGEPRALSFQGLQSEFADLVARISKEMNHYPILFELERVGAIEYEGEKIKLKTLEYTPIGDVEHGLSLLSSDIEALIETVEDNLTRRQGAPDLHLRTTYDNIDPAALESARQWILARGAAFQKDIREYLSQLDRDVNPVDGAGAERAKITVATFANGRVIEPVKQLKPKRRGRKPKVTK
jgi:hypothetical protein